MSMVVFALGCGGGQRASTPVEPQRVGDLEVRAWKTHSGPLQGASPKPANIIVTAGTHGGPAIAWVTSDGSDLLAVYCISPAELEGAQARAARQRNPPIAGYIEMTIQSGVHTDVCHPSRHPGTPPPPPPPTAPPTGPADPGPVTSDCGNNDAGCNYVILSPGKKGPAGEPPPPDKEIRQRFDLQLQRLDVFQGFHTMPGRTGAPG